MDRRLGERPFVPVARVADGVVGQLGGGALTMVAPCSDEAFGEAVGSVRDLLRDYAPPSFIHVPDPDAALFLCAVDHRTGYEAPHVVGGQGPFEGSELLWAAALADAGRRPGLLTAAGLAGISADEVAEMLQAGDETAADPAHRAELWRDLSFGLERDYGGQANRLLAAADGCLGGGGGLLERLTAFSAYQDPLAKQSQLWAKICERRGWFEVRDPEHWEVSADSVLMRLALRSGLVAPGELGHVREATRAAFKRVAAEAGVVPPVLDDLLWERGRRDPDLLGRAAGDLLEPGRDLGSSWY